MRVLTTFEVCESRRKGNGKRQAKTNSQLTRQGFSTHDRRTVARFGALRGPGKKIHLRLLGERGVVIPRQVATVRGLALSRDRILGHISSMRVERHAWRPALSGLILTEPLVTR